MIRWISRLPLALVLLATTLFVADAVDVPAWASYVQCKLVSNAACLNVADQTVTGGANFTTLPQSAGNITVDCGARPGQWIPNTGNFTITNPANDSYCFLDVENGGGAGVITLVGFSPNTMGGATVDTTNTHKFRLYVSRNHGTSTIDAKALQ